MGRLYVGKLARPHGLRGEIKLLEGLGGSGSWRNAQEIYIGSSPEDSECYRLRGVRKGGRFTIVALEGIEECERAKQLQGKLVFVAREQLSSLEDGVYYADDLLGMIVLDERGRHLGTLDDIFDNGAHEVYVVKNLSNEILLPVIEGVVLEVDVKAGRMVVNLPEGLLSIFGKET